MYRSAGRRQVHNLMWWGDAPARKQDTAMKNTDIVVKGAMFMSSCTPKMQSLATGKQFLYTFIQGKINHGHPASASPRVPFDLLNKTTQKQTSGQLTK